MRSSLAAALAIALSLTALLLVGCKEPEPPPVVQAPAPDPGWPGMATQDAAVQFDLEEAHYHMRKARYTAPDSYGAEQDMPLATGYAQWAYAMQTDNDKAVATVDHLILERGSQFDVPYGYTPRCRWCGYPMPREVTQWPVENGQKVLECPGCGAKDSFPTGLVLRCPECHDIIAGTNAGNSRCPTCGRMWRGLYKQCSRCGARADALTRQGQRCARCGAKWNFAVPFGSWPTRATVPVSITGGGKGKPCKGYSAWNGLPCPNKTQREDGYCWLHRHQAERDAVAAKPQSAGGAAAGAAAGGGGGMGGMSGGMGGMGGMGGAGPSAGGGMGTPPGAGGSKAGAGAKAGGKSDSGDEDSGKKASKGKADKGDE